MGRADRALRATLYLSIALSILQILTFGYGRDQGIYAVVARTMVSGGMPYRDAFDFKPPGIFVVYAIPRLLFGSSQAGIRIVEAVGMLATVAGLVRLADRFWGEPRIGWLAGAIASLIHAQLDFWHTAQPETFGGMLTIAGLLLATRPQKSWFQYLAGGFVFGAAGVLKPPLAGGGAVVAVAAFFAALPSQRAGLARAVAEHWRPASKPIIGVLLGGASPFGLVLAWFWLRGALPALHQTLFVFTPHYTQLGWEGRSFVGLLYEALVSWLIGYSSIVAVGVALGALQFRALRQRGHVGLLLGIVAIQLVGVALQGKFFPYHYAGVWPVTALLVALAWWQAGVGCARAALPAQAMFAVLAVVAIFARTATRDVPGSYWTRLVERARVIVRADRNGREALTSVADVDASANREVAAAVAHSVPPGEPIFVWGFEPVIYDLADRPLASPYLYNVPQRVPWAADEARTTLMHQLEARPPAAIIVEHGDVISMVTGTGDDSAAVLEREFSALAGFIRRRFDSPRRVQNFDVYLAKPTTR